MTATTAAPPATLDGHPAATVPAHARLFAMVPTRAVLAPAPSSARHTLYALAVEATLSTPAGALGARLDDPTGRLVDAIGCTRKTAVRRLAALEAHGLAEVDRDGRGHPVAVTLPEGGPWLKLPLLPADEMTPAEAAALLVGVAALKAGRVEMTARAGQPIDGAGLLARGAVSLRWAASASRTDRGALSDGLAALAARFPTVVDVDHRGARRGSTWLRLDYGRTAVTFGDLAPRSAAELAALDADLAEILTALDTAGDLPPAPILNQPGHRPGHRPGHDSRHIVETCRPGDLAKTGCNSTPSAVSADVGGDRSTGVGREVRQAATATVAEVLDQLAATAYAPIVSATSAPEVLRMTAGGKIRPDHLDALAAGGSELATALVDHRLAEPIPNEPPRRPAAWLAAWLGRALDAGMVAAVSGPDPWDLGPAEPIVEPSPDTTPPALVGVPMPEDLDADLAAVDLSDPDPGPRAPIASTDRARGLAGIAAARAAHRSRGLTDRDPAIVERARRRHM